MAADHSVVDLVFIIFTPIVCVGFALGTCFVV